MKKMDITKIDKENCIINCYTNNAEINKADFVSEVEVLIKWDEDIGYSGYKTIDAAMNNISGFVFARNENLPLIILEKYKMANIIENSLKDCNKIVNGNKINIFIFPTVSNFTIKNLNGVCGLTPWKKTILFFVNPINGWENALKETLCHEYCHTITHEYHMWQTLIDSIIFEGLAEHFREKAIGGKKAPWVEVLTKEESIKILNEIRPILNNVDFEFYNKLFFGNETFKLWTGYSLGYNVVREFLLKMENIEWNEILKMKPMDILESSGFLEDK